MIRYLRNLCAVYTVRLSKSVKFLSRLAGQKTFYRSEVRLILCLGVCQLVCHTHIDTHRHIYDNCHWEFRRNFIQGLPVANSTRPETGPKNLPTQITSVSGRFRPSELEYGKNCTCSVHLSLKSEEVETSG